MTTRAWGEEYRITTVCIDSYHRGEMRGRFYNPYLEGGQSFESITQFLLSMEQALDGMDFPKAFTARRSFAPPERDTGPPSLRFQTGQQATFQLRILFRQNASWQGSLVWLEGTQEQSFRSVLELIHLMDSALHLAAEGGKAS